MSNPDDAKIARKGVLPSSLLKYQRVRWGQKHKVVSQKSWIKNWLIYVIALLVYSGK